MSPCLSFGVAALRTYSPLGARFDPPKLVEAHLARFQSLDPRVELFTRQGDDLVVCQPIHTPQDRRPHRQPVSYRCQVLPAAHSTCCARAAAHPAVPHRCCRSASGASAIRAPGSSRQSPVEEHGTVLAGHMPPRRRTASLTGGGTLERCPRLYWTSEEASLMNCSRTSRACVPTALSSVLSDALCRVDVRA